LKIDDDPSYCNWKSRSRRAGGKRRTEEGNKNEFGSQDGQEMPNNRERIARKMAKLV